MTYSELCIECQREYDDFCEYLHAEEMHKEEQYVQVTKDMAMDAGDRTLEGQWIRW